jgi:hypothetical protein
LSYIEPQSTDVVVAGSAKSWYAVALTGSLLNPEVPDALVKLPQSAVVYAVSEVEALALGATATSI